MINLDSEDRRDVAERIAKADGPIAWGWMAIRDNQASAWQVALLTLRGATRCARVLLRYPSLLLGTEQLTPEQASKRFFTRVVRSRKTIDVPALKVALPDFLERSTWMTTESQPWYYLAPRGEWPFFNVHFTLPQMQGMPGLLDSLKGKNLPYYPTVQSALAELLYGVTPRLLGANIGPGVLVRLPGLSARLSDISSKDGVVRVAIEEGKPAGCKDCRLQVAWRTSADDSACGETN
jgi:hypothetical protein